MGHFYFESKPSNQKFMRKITTLVISLLLVFTVSVYSQSTPHFIFGKVTEQSTKLPLEFVIVSLHHPGDTNAVKETFTDKAGGFKLDSISEGKYFLEISLIGFTIFNTPPFSVVLGKDSVNIGTISLKASDILLKEIEVTSEKSVYENSIDRKVYYPEKDIQALTGSLSDILQNIPSVTVDADDIVSLRGSSNVTILINGKPSGLMNISRATALQQISGTSIERIEIITNPSAKYKPDGTAGIINIVLKKNSNIGFHGGLTLNAGVNDRYNGNITLNYKPGKLNIFGSYGYRQNYIPRTLTDSRINKDTVSGSQVLFDLNNSALGRPFAHTVNYGLDYSFNKKDKLGLSGNYITFFQNRPQNISTILKNSSGVTRDYKTDRTQSEDEREFETALSFEHNFKKEDHSIKFEAGYGNFNELEESRYTDTYNIPSSTSFTGHNTIHKSGYNFTAATEYTNPIGKEMELQAGYEGEFSYKDLDYSSEHFDNSLQRWIQDIDKTKRFKIRQDVHAVYTTFSKGIGRLSILAGLRAEQTFINSNLVTLNLTAKNNYFKLFPTLHLSYEINRDQQIGLSYSRRLNRPDPDELNPFPEYKDPRNIEAGNPNLKPEQIHSIELGYQFRKDAFSFIPSLYYRYKYDAFAEIKRYINDTTLLTTLDNLSSNQSAGLEFVFTYNFKKIMNLNLSSNLFYNTLNASNIGYKKNKTNFSFDSKLAASFNVTLATKLQVNANYRSSMLTAQGKTLPVYFINIGIRQDIFDNKASLLLTVSDVFNTMKFVEEIDAPFLYQKVTRRRTSRIIYLGFSWRFGVTPKNPADDLIFEDKL